MTFNTINSSGLNIELAAVLGRIRAVAVAVKAVILVYKIFLPRIYYKVTVDSSPSVCIFIQQETSYS